MFCNGYRHALLFPLAWILCKNLYPRNLITPQWSTRLLYYRMVVGLSVNCDTLPVIGWCYQCMIGRCKTFASNAIRLCLDCCSNMMTSCFRVTGPLYREFTGHWWISPYKGQWREALMCSLICPWVHGWINNREAGDLRRHRAHYDVTVMNPTNCCRISGAFQMHSSLRCFGRFRRHS